MTAAADKWVRQSVEALGGEPVFGSHRDFAKVVGEEEVYLASLVKQFWAPNNPGDNITGVNNFRKGYIERYNYYNSSDRVVGIGGSNAICPSKFHGCIPAVVREGRPELGHGG